MSNRPIVVTGSRVGGIELPTAASRNIVRSPLVVLPTASDKKDLVKAKASAYRVTLVANGKTFNMLLPPSVESKHPSRSNPLQLPGLQIDAGVAISKLKIPGFFPIYQHLGVESLTISMSGMFTGYDGVERISTATNWEAGSELESKEGQDSYASACELYDFAVKNKALIEVTIYTSDGTFTPKKSDTTNFRDSSSNIKFKGYIKDFKQVYIRQDRNYYMLKFEIIDLGGGAKTCLAKVKDKERLDKTRKKLEDIALSRLPNTNSIFTSDNSSDRFNNIPNTAAPTTEAIALSDQGKVAVQRFPLIRNELTLYSNNPNAVFTTLPNSIDNILPNNVPFRYIGNTTDNNPIIEWYPEGVEFTYPQVLSTPSQKGIIEKNSGSNNKPYRLFIIPQ